LLLLVEYAVNHGGIESHVGKVRVDNVGRTERIDLPAESSKLDKVAR
jgi:hypothetical protein